MLHAPVGPVSRAGGAIIIDHLENRARAHRRNERYPDIRATRVAGLQTNSYVLANERVGNVETINRGSELDTRGGGRMRCEKSLQSVPIGFPNRNRGNRHIVCCAHRLDFSCSGIVENNGETCSGSSRASDLLPEKTPAALNERAFAVEILSQFGIGLTDIYKG